MCILPLLHYVFLLDKDLLVGQLKYSKKKKKKSKFSLGNCRREKVICLEENSSTVMHFAF